MIHENSLLYNIAELVRVEGREGLRMQRVPEAVRQQLLQPAAEQVLMTAGCEIRFVVIEGDEPVRITLSTPEPFGGDRRVHIFHGPFHNPHYYESPAVLGAEPITLELRLPTQLLRLPEEPVGRQGFSPRVVRVVLPIFCGPVHLHSIEGPMRPPRADEMPQRRLLSYGTSITHGIGSTSPHLAWSAQAAWRLGADLVSLGVGGACQCEQAFADYIAERSDWDWAAMCLSVNMLGYGYTAKTFRERVAAFLERVATAEPRRPVLAFSVLPFYEFILEGNEAVKATSDEYRHALKSIVADLALPNLHFAPGPDMLRDLGGLDNDLIHPGDHGMIEIGERVSEKLREIIASR